jgi:hypothetical protein
MVKAGLCFSPSMIGLSFAGVHGMDTRPPNKRQRMLLLFMLISLHQIASLFVKCIHWILSEFTDLTGKDVVVI